MKVVSRMLVLTGAALGCAGCAGCHGMDDEPTGTTKTTSHVLIPEPAATDQSNTPRDLALAADVRRRLVADDHLSLRAKNVVLVVRDGVVTLRGDVASKADHERLIASVASVAGVVRLDDRTVVTNGEGR